MGPDTHLMGETRDPRTGNLKVGPQTRDPGHLFYMGANARDPGHWKRDWALDETRDSKQTFLVEPGTQEIWSKLTSWNAL